MRIHTIGHGRRTLDELVAALDDAGVRTLVDVRRFPRSRRYPQFDGEALAESLPRAGIDYRHEVELGGRRSAAGAGERYACLTTPAFRGYAAWMSDPAFAAALARALAAPAPCLMCAETLWWRCHRRLIADLLWARGHEAVHLVRPGETSVHRPFAEAEARDGSLYLCGDRVA